MTMNKLETLNELVHLQRSRFGRFYPRHGLKLLYWFAHDCISFENSNNITTECDPENGDFGFHFFENRYDRDGIKLLPDVDHLYYVVGNLNSAGAEELPDYVSEDNTGLQDDSNMDRIIVSICDYDWFDKVYVTEHDDRTNFNRSATYRISKGLLKTIRRLGLDEFLTQAGYQGGYILQLPVITYDRRVVSPQNPDPRPTNSTASSVRPQNVQECHVVIEATPELEKESDNVWNEISSSRKKNRCCTIL